MRGIIRAVRDTRGFFRTVRSTGGVVCAVRCTGGSSYARRCRGGSRTAPARARTAFLNDRTIRNKKYLNESNAMPTNTAQISQHLTTPPPGWQASLQMAFEQRNQRTVLSKNRHAGPLRLQRPFYPEKDVCHAYILHPPGGIVGGDRLEIAAQVAAGASALLTTPGATKFYRSNDHCAEQENVLQVATDGHLEWFPQETIFYPGARASANTRFELEEGAGLMGWEILCIGLPACGKPFNAGKLQTALHINRSNKPIFIDRLRVTNHHDMARPTGLRGHSVTATFVATGGEALMLAPLREILDAQKEGFSGITLLDDLLVARYLGDASAQAKELFRKLWAWLRPHLFGRPSCPPRIWET